MIALTAAALRLRFAAAGRNFDIEKQPELFAAAYAVCAELAEDPAEYDALGLGMRVADMLPKDTDVMDAQRDGRAAPDVSTRRKVG